MSDIAIAVDHLTKRFRIPLDHSTTLKYRVTHPRSTSRYRNLLAVDDVSFEVPRGEFLGITGPNGCGKSTLLKVLSRIYTPDRGSCRVEGRISPFLELGVGFNPELTARQNIFLGGAVLGLTRGELAARVDPILDFAELTEFADQKIKNFSSGMAVRLAFAVAIQADADVLLMDEVLAVGDARFQERCFDVFARYKKQSRTIVLVTHDLGALGLYSDRVLLLQHGKLVADGRPNDVVALYRRSVGEASDNVATPSAGGAIDDERRWGSRDVEITGVRLLDEAGTQHTTFTSGRPMDVAIDWVVHREPPDGCVFGLAFKRGDGLGLAGPNTRHGRHEVPLGPPGTRGSTHYRLPALNLLSGHYLMSAAAYDRHLSHALDHREDVVDFRVVDEQGRIGYVDLGGEWSEAAAPTGPEAESKLSGQDLPSAGGTNGSSSSSGAGESVSRAATAARRAPRA